MLTYKNMASCDYIKRWKRISKPQKAIFIDRDGTLHVDKVETTLEKGLELFPDTIEALKTFQRKGYRIIVVTNQRGIAKGHITYEQMHEFNRALRLKLARHFCFIDAIYYCPHKKDDNCACAKPKTGMFERAKREFHIDMERSYVVGDRIGDMMAGRNAGIPQGHRMMVTTGIYAGGDYRTEPGLVEVDPIICSCLSEVADRVE